jgi:HSP20 family molecular chaperone IbpA
MYHALEDMMSDAFVLGASSETGVEKRIAPNYHSLYTNGSEVLEIELPGVTKESLQIEVKEHILIVTGSRAPYALASSIETEENDSVKKIEGANTKKALEEAPKLLTYLAKFKMSRIANVEEMKADFKDGLLRVVIPRRKELKPRRIQINF